VAVLVTRPAPDNQVTAEALRARGFEPLVASMLVFQPLPFRDDEAVYSGVILTSANAMRAIKEGKMEATVLYPPTQAADGVRLARLLVQEKGMSDLVQPSVPRRVVLDAPVVTKDNVDEYMSLGFES